MFLRDLEVIIILLRYELQQLLCLRSGTREEVPAEGILKSVVIIRDLV